MEPHPRRHDLAAASPDRPTAVRAAASPAGRDILPEAAESNGNKAKRKMFSSCQTPLACERRRTAELHTSSQAPGLCILNNICLSFSSLSFAPSSAEGDKQANVHGDHKPLS